MKQIIFYLPTIGPIITNLRQKKRKRKHTDFMCTFRREK